MKEKHFTSNSKLGLYAGSRMIRIINKDEKEELQKKGYMCEHLLCLYSVLADQTALYNEDFPVFISDYGELDVILFGFRNKSSKPKCLQELSKMPINTLNTVSPTMLRSPPGMKTMYIDWDFHINLDHFDLDLKGNKYKDIRYRVRQVEKLDYQLRISREFTPKHTYILSRHMTHHQFGVWDFEELLSLERFFREHDHGLIMEAYKDNRLIGFDIIDFFEDNRIMVVPLGIYLDIPLVSYFLMYENLKYAKDRGYKWLDIGPACGVEGLKHFKEKWHAKPKYTINVQTLNIK